MAVDWQVSIAGSSSSCFSTTFMPMPPPPAAALTSTGRPTFFTKASPSLGSRIGGVPGTIGTPALLTVLRAETLSPIFCIAAAGGPMKLIPALSHIRTKSAFSARKP